MTTERWEIREALTEYFRVKEDSILAAGGYKPAQSGLWQKNGVLCTRGAALQNAKQELSDKGESTPFD